LNLIEPDFNLLSHELEAMIKTTKIGNPRPPLLPVLVSLDPNLCSFHSGLTSSTSAQNDARFMRNRARKALSGNQYIKFPKTSSSWRLALSHLLSLTR